MSDEKHEIINVESVAIERAGSREDPIAIVVAEKIRTANTAEELSAILAFAERFDANHARKSYADAMVRLKADLSTRVAHDRVVDYDGGKGRVKFSYASLAGISDSVIPVLAVHGFAHDWATENDDRVVRVTCRLRHRDGHVETCSMSGPPDTKGGKIPVQAVASTTTTLKRYTLCSILGIATGDMPDADDAPAPEPDSVDPVRTNRLITAIRKRGRTTAEAEALVERQAARWTAADREVIAEWLRGQAATSPAAAPSPVTAPSQDELVEDERRMAEEEK